ncbi:MAG: OadG family protein [Desulfobacterales bacterium]
MIIEGLKITLLGMVVVFSFLGLLVVIVNLSDRILKPFTDKEELAYASMSRKKERKPRQEDEKRKIMAVISAAISAYRAGRK